MFLLLTFAACGKMDDNGELGAMWQLIKLERKADKQVLATSEDAIYYSFSRQLLKTQRMTENQFYLSEFHRTHDSLYIDKVYMSPYDEVVAVEALVQYGADKTGRFHFDHLSKDRMILSNTENVLTFRKY